MNRGMLFLLFFLSIPVWAKAHQPEFSTAGFYALPETGRDALNMNVAWRFFKGDSPDAFRADFNDSSWEVVSLPHGIELLPTEASGCVNYQGPVWYRKRFVLPDSLAGKKLFLHFEAIMGKSKIWVNGELLKTHFGGFLPAIADISTHAKPGEENVIAVWADNSNDPMYPPGKPQNVLDFTYAGGIYRDAWLVAHNDVYITNPNHEDEVAGGGLLVSYNNVSKREAGIHLQLEVRNETKRRFKGNIHYRLEAPEGTTVKEVTREITIAAGDKSTAKTDITISGPALWSPDHPQLHNLHVTIADRKGHTIDGYRRRIGIRSIEFKGEEGLWINGEPYPQPLMGANRHQDFAVLGNALPNSLHWRDAKKLKDVGLKVIRNAHYPQDPAFMDACDELGLFVIVNTPGWQFWNEAPVFEQRVYSDIRNMVRRDRNRASIFLWEPILNETWYPADFAQNTRDIVTEEFPFANNYTASDAEARGSEHFPVQFAHPPQGDERWAIEHIDPEKTYFTREWGDNVDDWSSHNSPSRVNRDWGEQPMLTQAQHYANPNYKYTSYNSLYQTSRQHIGGALWHPFDHQRGYHPDPFYGGLMDVFRQPKYSYYLFMAQRPAQESDLIAETGPMVYIAHEMTPFSGKDVKVYSNCEEVRLTVFRDGPVYHYRKDTTLTGMPSPIIAFENVYNFMDDKAKSREQKQDEVFMRAEGLMNGQVVATHEVRPARRPEKIMLWLDNEEVPLKADGSDVTTVLAAVADNNGNIKRLNNYFIAFEIEGEGTLVANEHILTNPAPVQWGTAPVLVRSTLQPGEIKVKASVLFEGEQMPMSGELIFSSVKSPKPAQLYHPDEASHLKLDKDDDGPKTGAPPDQRENREDMQREIEQLKKEINLLKIKEVEKQQEEFGEK